MMPTISRRGLILGGISAATLALAFPLSARTLEAITVEEFRALSARLIGAKLGDLNMSAAAKLLDGFISTGRGADLARLAADPWASAGPLADEIVAAWYSGSYDTHNGLASFGLTSALLWGALDFTKSPGLCGRATGYWAHAPQG